MFLSRTSIFKATGQWHWRFVVLAFKSLLSTYFAQGKESKGEESMHFIGEHIVQCESALPSLHKVLGLILCTTQK